MSKGLKQMMAAANAAEELPPVQVSPEATRVLAEYLRQWSGWPSARLVFGDPMPVSPWASTDHETHTFVVNVDRLLLNPNRVLLTVTPFRMRQEAVLTGAAMHEAGHARHSKWLPRSEEAAKVKPVLHSDGSEPTNQVISLARLFEEPRVEGLMARDADRIGATGLGWTMRATAAHVLPATTMPTNPNEAIMSLVRSWLLRAGRQYAIHHWDQSHRLRGWVKDFTSMVASAIAAHLQKSGVEMPQAVIDSQIIMTKLTEAVVVTDDTGPTLVDMARDILNMLFPETPPEEQPEAEGGCTGNEQQESEESEDEGESEPGGKDEGDGDGEDEAESESGDGAEGDEEGESGEGNTEPEDEGEGDEPGEGDSGQDDEAEPEESEPGDSDGDGEPEDGEPEGGEADSASEGDGEDEVSEGSDTDDTSELAKALAEMEARATSEAEGEAEEDAEEAEEEAAAGAGAGAAGGNKGGWRRPTVEEREIQKGAEKFLRDLIAPSESSTVVLTESPSATVDGAALAAWKAGGQVRDPRFFVRTRRTIEPSPPVQIGVTCDISGSMDELQAPTAVLSWALSNAALDLRNFAGRGQQVESTLIHWGDTARVIQRNGETLPGIREWECTDGTQAMGAALRLVEEQMPGFFEVKEKPVNRLLVCFTDWELWGHSVPEASAWIGRALEAGVNIISVVPGDYGNSRWAMRNTTLPRILSEARIQRGKHTLLKYNPMFPSRVWDEAAKSLATQ